MAAEASLGVEVKSDHTTAYLPRPWVPLKVEGEQSFEGHVLRLYARLFF